MQRGLFLAITLLLLLPLAGVTYVPMVDLPGHLARLHALQNYDTVPQFRDTYVINAKPIPNLALEMIALPLAKVVSLFDASRLFVAASILIFAWGCWILSYSIYGRLTPSAVLALFVQYNSTFFYGFVAYQLGVGLSLGILGLWYRWRKNWTPSRVAILLVLGVIVYLSHFGGYMYLGLGIGWLTFLLWLKEKRISIPSLIGLLPVIPPMVIYLSLGKSKGQAGQIEFSSLMQKARHSMMLLIGYDMFVDAAIALLLLATLIAAWKYGRFRLHPDIFSLGVIFAVLFLVMPHYLLTGSDADTRMLIGAGVFLLLGTTCDLPPRTGKVLYCIAVSALLARVAFCGWVWRSQSDFVAGHVDFLNTIPVGARVYPILRLPDDPKTNKFERVLIHIPDLATVLRNAIVPTTFAVVGQHSLVERKPLWFRDIDRAQPQAFSWNKLEQEYDVIWQYGQDHSLRTVLDSRYHLAGQHGDARLYRIRE